MKHLRSGILCALCLLALTLTALAAPVALTVGGKAVDTSGLPRQVYVHNGTVIGSVTSGGFGPTLNGPCAMGYVAKAHSAPGTQLNLIVRGKPLPAVVATMPFVPNGYKR